MTRLAELLARRIAASGPITVAEYMAECLMHPEHGYYSTRDPFGVAGDFTTAPEISQMFGELVGLWLAQVWTDQGARGAFALAELGPGRGTLMADMLRATQAVPGFAAAAELHLVETSPTLRRIQRETLAGHDVTWHERVETLPEAPHFLVANEFFDALPIRQFQRDAGGWRERVVGLLEGRLAMGLSDAAPLADLDHRLRDTAPGDIVEICPVAGPVLHGIAGRVERFGGAALIVDYGCWRSRGDTLQAVRNHRFESPLANPGEADLTAHVDFEVLARAGERAGVRASGVTPQGVFLERLGIAHRARALAAGLSGDALEAHVAAHRRLTHPAEMGTLFKTIAFTPKHSPRPPALDP